MKRGKVGAAQDAVKLVELGGAPQGPPCEGQKLIEIAEVGPHGVLRGPFLGDQELAKGSDGGFHVGVDRSSAAAPARMSDPTQHRSLLDGPASGNLAGRRTTLTTEAHQDPAAAGPARAEPRCTLFGRCGGCQLQDLPYDDQLALKTGEVRRLFEGIDVAACVGSPSPYGYRSKLTPHFARPRPEREPAIGFLAIGPKRRTVDVPTCPIATPAVNARLAALRDEVRARWASYRRGATLLVREAASGVTVDPREVITEQVGPLSLQFTAGDFFQNNPFLLPELVEHAAAKAAAGGARFLVDAYCGSGLLGLAAASRFERVLGVEVSESAVRWARANAERNGLANCSYVAADASTIFAGIDFQGSEAAVIIDPPRKGCSEDFLRQLITFSPRTIVYVSCNPETQARDVTALRAAGYTCLNIQPFDMFPQTRHVETVATLSRSGDPSS